MALFLCSIQAVSHFAIESTDHCNTWNHQLCFTKWREPWSFHLVFPWKPLLLDSKSLAKGCFICVCGSKLLLSSICSMFVSVTSRVVTSIVLIWQGQPNGLWGAHTRGPTIHIHQQYFGNIRFIFAKRAMHPGTRPKCRCWVCYPLLFVKIIKLLDITPEGLRTKVRGLPLEGFWVQVP